jgi:hypothetical protein
MATEGRVPVLRKSRWPLLKQRFRLRDLLRYNLKKKIARSLRQHRELILN